MPKKNHKKPVIGTGRGSGVRNSLGRRKFLKKTAAGFAGATAGSLLGFPYVKAAKRRIVVTAGGGAYGKSQVEAYFKPFMKETGIEVHATLSGLSLAQKKAQVQTGNVTADLVSLGFADVEIMSKNGWLVPIDYSQFRKEDLDGIDPVDRHKYGMGFIYWAEVMAYRKDIFSGGNHPKNWTEFWNAKKFPGQRAFGDPGYRYSFEFALLADGVPIDKLYPLDIDRAFRSLSKIRKDVVAWWGKSAAQPAQLINDKEVVLCSVANGRIKAVVESGAPVGVNWNQGMLYHTAYGIMKGAKNVEDTMKLLAFVARPESQARMAEIVAYGPTNKNAFKLIDAKVAANLPSNPAYRKNMFVKNDAWWVAESAPGKSNRQLVIEKWEKWKLN